MIDSMSLRRGLAAAVFAAFLCGAPLALSMVSTSNAPSMPSAPSASTAEDTIKAAMKTLNKNTKELKSLVEAKEKFADALPLVVEIEQALISAKSATPELVAGIEDAKKKEKEALAFRKTMIEMLGHALKLEEALLDERPEDAKKQYNELAKMKAPNHERFKGQ